MVTPFAWSQPHPVNEHVRAASDELRRRGHEVTVTDPWSLGRVSAVQREAGQLRAGANPRGMQGYAVCR